MSRSPVLCSRTVPVSLSRLRTECGPVSHRSRSTMGSRRLTCTFLRAACRNRTDDLFITSQSTPRPSASAEVRRSCSADHSGPRRTPADADELRPELRPRAAVAARSLAPRAMLAHSREEDASRNLDRGGGQRCGSPPADRSVPTTLPSGRPRRAGWKWSRGFTSVPWLFSAPPRPQGPLFLERSQVLAFRPFGAARTSFPYHPILPPSPPRREIRVPQVNQRPGPLANDF